MVKSRQGKHQTVKSSLNVIREVCVLLFTAMFWLYCCTAIIVIGGSLLHINVETVLMIRTVLNIEIDDINYLFKLIAIFAVITFSLLTLSLITQKLKGSKGNL